MKTQKTVLLVLLCIAMAFSTLVGCKQKVETEKDSEIVKDESDTEQTNNSTESELSFDEAPVITLIYPNWDEDEIVNAGIDLKDNVWVRHLFNKTGIRFNLQFIASSGYKDKIKMMIAAKQDFDIFRADGPSEWVQLGAIDENMGDLFEEYGQDIINNATKSSLNAVTVKGELVAMPIPDFKICKHINLIRKDWLDMLNLDIPKTKDDMEQFLSAVRNTDMDGNGKKDEYGISFPLDFNFSWNYAGGWGGAFWDDEGTFVDFANRKIVFWATTDSARGYYANFAEWLEKGYIDPDSLSQDQDTMHAKVYNGKVGIVRGYLSDIPSKEKEASEILGKKVTFEPLPPMEAEVDAGYSRSGGIDRAFYVNRNSDKKVEAVKFLNYFYTEEGSIFTTYGIKDVDYNEVDGKYVKIEDMREKSMIMILSALGPTNENLYWDHYFESLRSKYENHLSDDNVIEKEIEKQKKWHNIANEQWSTNYYTYWYNDINPDSIPELKQYPDYTRPFEEYRLKFLSGHLDALNDDDWNEYLNKMDSAGLNKVLNAVSDAFFNNAYDKNKDYYKDFQQTLVE